MDEEEEKRLRGCWGTPDDFFQTVDKEFDFQLDAAASPHNAKCPHFLTDTPGYDFSGDALDSMWVGDFYVRSEEDKLKTKIIVAPQKVYHLPVKRVWLNPGFSNMLPWVEKAYNEAQKHPDAVIVVMALISPSTEWWMKYARAASEIRLIGGERVQFVAPPGVKQSSNARENCLIIFRPKDNRPFEDTPEIWTWDWRKNI